MIGTIVLNNFPLVAQYLLIQQVTQLTAAAQTVMEENHHDDWQEKFDNKAVELLDFWEIETLPDDPQLREELTDQMVALMWEA